MRGWKWLFIVAPLLLIVTCTGSLLIGLANAVTDDMRTSMDETEDALFARDLNRIRSAFAEVGDEEIFERNMATIFVLLPAGSPQSCEQTNLRTRSALTTTGSGRYVDVTRSCQFADARVEIKFTFTRRDDGADLTSLNVRLPGN